MNVRYRIRRKSDDVIEPKDTETREPYGLWDTREHQWVDKYGAPDDTYYACSRAVAEMRRRDLNIYEADRGGSEAK